MTSPDHDTDTGTTESGTTPQVVFACFRNGGRSVTSRVLTDHYAQGRVRARSAGTQPGEHIHAEVADVLARPAWTLPASTPSC